MLFNNNQKPNKYFLGFLGFLSSFSFLSCCVCGNPGTWGWCLKLYAHFANYGCKMMLNLLNSVSIGTKICTEPYHTPSYTS